MTPFFPDLQEAQQMMPFPLMSETSSNLVLTLAFIKLLTIHWHKQTQHIPDGMNHATWFASMAASGRIVMDDDCTFDAMLRGEPDQAGTTVNNALLRLTQLQPHGALDGVFRPENYVFLSGYFKLIGNPAKLATILANVDNAKWRSASLSLACGDAFANAIGQMLPEQPQTNRDLARLMARLLDPQPTESVFDPACGVGLSLLACAQVLAEREPGASLHLHGMEPAWHCWTLAKMLMLLADYPQARILPMAPLRPGMLELGQQKFPLADMVLTIVPEEASQSPVTRVKPHHRRKTRHSLPEDGRAALAWQALNSMKKRGRMALLLPANGLNMNDQVALGQHLVESNLLEAVIRVPACSAARPAKEALLLLVRGARTQTDVAFISPNGLAQGNDTQIDADAILQALQAFREGKTHPALLVLPPSVIASQQYQLDVASYAASVTGMTA